jgi:hypothetical protein
MIGIAGFATVIGYHDICCSNYRWTGEYKNGVNSKADWLRFLIPLVVQICMAIGLIIFVSRQKSRSKQIDP